MEALGLQVIQFAWFRPAAQSVRASQLFATIFGEEPDQTQNNNKGPTPAAPYHSLASGEKDDEVRQVTVQPGRIDVQIVCPDRPNSGPWAWKLSDGLKSLSTYTETICRTPAVHENTLRTSVILVLLRNTASAKEASAVVAERIGRAGLDEAIDLQFQLNVRKDAHVSPFKINRLLRFSTNAVQEIHVALAGGLPSSPLTLANERHLATLTVDINTVPTANPIAPALVSDLIRELSSEAARIARDGTIKALGI